MRNFKSVLVCFVLALFASTMSVKAERFYHVELVPVLENGATGLVYATPNGSAYSKYYNYLYNIRQK